MLQELINISALPPGDSHHIQINYSGPFLILVGLLSLFRRSTKLSLYNHSPCYRRKSCRAHFPPDLTSSQLPVQESTDFKMMSSFTHPALSFNIPEFITLDLNDSS